MPLTNNPYDANVLLLVDGFNLSYRSWKVTNFTKGFKNDEKYPTCHVYNSMMKLRMWLNAVGLKQGKRICPAFSFYENRGVRQALYPEYKAQREKEEFRTYEVTTPSGDYSAMTVNPPGEVEKIFKCFPGVFLRPENNDGETDDVLSTFINIHRRRQGVQIWHMTNDHDAWFDVRDNVTVTGDPRQPITREKIAEEFFSDDPRKVPLAKALFGDSSDNIKKVPMLRPKSGEAVAEVLRACTRDPDRDGIYFAPGFIRACKRILRDDPKHLVNCIVGQEEHIDYMERMIRPRNTLQLIETPTSAKPQLLKNLLSWYGIKKDLASYVQLCLS